MARKQRTRDPTMVLQQLRAWQRALPPRVKAA
jgi:hypothetical protein